MLGVIELSEHILCKKDVLGKTFECKFDGIKALIYFPLFPELTDVTSLESFKPLEPPSLGVRWSKGGEPIYWGSIMRLPSGESSIHFLALNIECPEEYAQRIYESVETWEHSFVDFIRLKTKQGVKRDKNKRRDSCHLHLFDNNKFIEPQYSIKVFADIPNPDVYASVEDISNAIDFANSKKELLLEYQMLLSAYEVIRLKQNRRAILDACSAIEISIVEQIQKYCSSNDIPITILTNKYRYLGERIKLLI